MNSKRFLRGLGLMGTRLLAAGLIVYGIQSPAGLRLAPADDLISQSSADAEHASWKQGILLAEIAWLASPATFHEHLTAVLAGDCLEIHGKVSNEPTRSLVMNMAREAARMTIVDHMETAAAPALVAPNRSLSMIYRDCVQAIYHGCPQLSRGLTISTLDRGEVLVRGEVPTLEDKLAVSRCLKTVVGCNCVKNQVRTKTGTQASLNTVQRKPAPQDNSLLARLGLVQPRTQIASTPITIAHGPGTSVSSEPARPQLVSIPNAAPILSPPQLRPAVVPEIVRTSATEAPAGPAPKPTPLVEPVLPISTTPAIDTGKLRHAIAITCGIDERTIHVAGSGAKALAITMSVPDVDTGRNLAPKVLAMPELVPFGVNLEISISH